MIRNLLSKLGKLLIRSRPYILGFVSGILMSITVVGVNAFKEPVNHDLVLPAPFTENADVDQLLSYSKGAISNRSDRYYHRGVDWIMIKDFPDHIKNYEGDFRKISDLLWKE